MGQGGTVVSGIESSARQRGLVMERSERDCTEKLMTLSHSFSREEKCKDHHTMLYLLLRSPLLQCKSAQSLVIFWYFDPQFIFMLKEASIFGGRLQMAPVSRINYSLAQQSLFWMLIGRLQGMPVGRAAPVHQIWWVLISASAAVWHA